MYFCNVFIFFGLVLKWKNWYSGSVCRKFFLYSCISLILWILFFGILLLEKNLFLLLILYLVFGGLIYSSIVFFVFG